MNQNEWKALTQWDGAMPSPAEAWALLQHPNVGASFRDAVRAETAGSRLLKACAHASFVAAGRDLAEAAADLAAITGVRHTARGLESLARVEIESAEWKLRFANLMSGRFTELLFAAGFGERIASLQLELREVTAEGTFIDYVISDGTGFEISLNLKNAGVMMRQAMQFFGLEPADTIPIATYKIYGSEAGTPNLIYVYLIDWDLLAKLRGAYWNDVLTDAERRVFTLIVSSKRIPEVIEDAFIKCTVEERFDKLRRAAGYEAIPVDSFRAISGARCRQIFLRNRKRSPYVYVQKMNTDPNVHISIEAETVAFQRLIDDWLATPEKRAALIEGLRQTAPMDVPDPPM